MEWLMIIAFVVISILDSKKKSDQAKQQRYDSLVLELEQLIAHSGDDEEDEYDDEDEEDEYDEDEEEEDDDEENDDAGGGDDDARGVRADDDI